MDNRFSILFFPKGDSLNKEGKASIYLRITLVRELSVGQYMDPRAFLCKNIILISIHTQLLRLIHLILALKDSADAIT